MLPLCKKSLLRLSTADGVAAWYHASPKDETTLRLRRIPFDPSGRFDDKTLEQINSDYLDCKQYTFRDAGQVSNLPVERFSVDEPTAWQLVAERMERGINQPQRRTIPVTALRRLYDWLRDRPTKVEKEFLHASLARHFLSDPRKLVDLFLTSRAEFAPYDNQTEGFVEGRTADRFLASERSGTDPLVKQFQFQEVVHLEATDGGLRFHYVDREVSPRRSSKNTGPWLFADGRPGTESGAGGMDLLLSVEDERGPCPVVGEIKVGRDETPFFALIQAMTYAAEICTPNQGARLRRHYPSFAGLADTSCAELALVFSELPSEITPTLATTEYLIAELYPKHPDFGKVVRRITHLEASLRDG